MKLPNIKGFQGYGFIGRDMKEQEQDIVKQFPLGLKPQDRLFLEMAVADGDVEEASRLVKDYDVGTSNGSTPLGLCQDWLVGIKTAEKHHCQNVIDLHSQGRPIAGMQAEFSYERIT